MTEEQKGLRALPPALLLGFAIWFVMIAVRATFWMTMDEPWAAIRFNLVGDGTAFACEILGILGSFELARRLGGRAALGITIAGWAFAGVLAVDCVYASFQFMEKMWEHETLLKTIEYAYYAAWLAVPVGVCIALLEKKRELGIFIVIVTVLTWPPPLLADKIYSWLPHGESRYAIDGALRAVRFGFLLAGFAAVARGAAAAVADRVAAASGLRLAAKSQWLRLIAIAAVPLITLMVIGSKGGKGSLEMLKLAMITTFVVNIISFAQFGVGALRTARGSVAELGRWPFVLAGAASVWAAGVVIGQLPWVYKALYKPDSFAFGSSELTRYMEALSVAMPVVVVAGMTLTAVAISGLAAKRGNEELRGHAQSKGAGFVTLTLVNLAMAQWMIPKAMRGDSLSSFVMLSLLALGCAIAAIVMIAKLLGLGADELDREAGLPTATVVETS